MSEKAVPMENRVMPLRITDHDGDKVYELDFSRESIKFAENKGFKVSEVTDFPATKIPEFFYYAFRKNHKNVARSQTDALLEKMGGLTGPILERMFQLYNQATVTHLLIDEEEFAKNTEVTVEL